MAPLPLPSTFTALTMPTHGAPSTLQLSTLPLPSPPPAGHALIRVHASSINPYDIKRAGGMVKAMTSPPDTLPLRIGYDVAGTIAALPADSSADFSVGDAVWARVPEISKEGGIICRGTWAEYALAPFSALAHKPQGLSFADAASLPLVALTALQAFERAGQELAGKTVFVPAGLSGTGAAGLQIAKNVYKAAKVITTVSTGKEALLKEKLGAGVADIVIDYKTQDVMKEIPKGSVDFIFDTTGGALGYLSLLRPHTGKVVTIATIPSGTEMAKFVPGLPWYLKFMLNAVDGVNRARAWRWSAAYEYFFLQTNRKDLETVGRWTEEGSVKAVVGEKVKMQDLEAVKKVAEGVASGKGGTGKVVIEMV